MTNHLIYWLAALAAAYPLGYLFGWVTDPRHFDAVVAQALREARIEMVMTVREGKTS